MTIKRKRPRAVSPIWTGWHFLVADQRLQFEPRTLVEAGQTLEATGPLSLCANGLHASRRAIDALEYAPGPIVCRVQLLEEIVEGDDKACARKRTCLWVADATAVLHEFACDCAENALRTAKIQNRQCWQAIETKRRWLKGEASDEELNAAGDTWNAAWAARNAAWAARNAAWAAWAARNAAWAAWSTWDAARATRAAAWAARNAAWAAAWAAQNQRLESMLFELAPSGDCKEASHGAR